MIYPNALKQGDTVMIIAPSGPPTIESVLKRCECITRDGVIRNNREECLREIWILAGSDQVRLDDIHEAFTNNEVKAIFVHEVVMEVLVFFLTFNMKLLGKIQKSFGDIAILQLYILLFHVMQSL